MRSMISRLSVKVKEEEQIQDINVFARPETISSNDTNPFHLPHVNSET